MKPLVEHSILAKALIVACSHWDVLHGENFIIDPRAITEIINSELQRFNGRLEIIGTEAIFIEFDSDEDETYFILSQGK